MSYSFMNIPYVQFLIPSNYATMRFQPESLHGANAGLDTARAIMEKVKKDFSWISYGDLWTLGGVAAIQVGDTTGASLNELIFSLLGNGWAKDPLACWACRWI